MIKTPKPLRALKILLIENDPGDARLISELLRNDDTGAIELLEAQTLSKGVQNIIQDQPDAVLLDLRLPDSSGLESVRKICGVAPRIPVIVLAGLDDQELGLMAVKAGAQDSINKCYVQINSLVPILCKSIERQRLVNEQEQQTKIFAPPMKTSWR